MEKPELPDTDDRVSVLSSYSAILEGWFSYDDLLKIVRYMEWLGEVGND